MGVRSDTTPLKQIIDSKGSGEAFKQGETLYY